jgi:K+-transporting ATPase KdpF subunit
VTAVAMTWLAGLCAVGLFVYLFYALVKPERF